MLIRKHQPSAVACILHDSEMIAPQHRDQHDMRCRIDSRIHSTTSDTASDSCFGEVH
jgi:hypothetical protein